MYSLERLAYLGVVALGAFGAGSELLRRARLPYVRGAALATGLALYSLIILFLGLTHLLYQSLILQMVWIFFLGTLVFRYRDLTECLRDAWRMLCALNGLGRVMIGMAVAILAFHLLQSLMPLYEFDDSYDLCRSGLHYHFLHFRPDLFSTNLPSTFFMFGVLGVSLHGFGMIASISVLELLALGLLASAYVWRHLTLSLVPWVLVMIFSLPMAFNVTKAVFEELAVCMTVLAALLYLIEAYSQSDPRSARACMAAAVLWTVYSFSGKTTTLALGVAIGVVACCWATGHSDKRRAWVTVLASGCLGFMLMGAPWLARSYFYTGNPVWPFAQSIFPTPYWPSDAMSSFEQYLTKPFEHRWHEALMLPVNFARSFEAARPVGADWGVWIFACSVPTLFLCTRRQHVRLLWSGLLIFTGVAYISLYPVGRYWSPAAMILLIMALHAMDAWVLPGRWRHHTVGFLLVAVALFETGVAYQRWIPTGYRDAGITQRSFLRAVFDDVYARDLPYKVIPDEAAMFFLNNQHDDGRGVLVIGGRIYRYRTPAYFGDPRLQYWVDFRALNRPGAFVADLQAKHIGYVSIEKRWWESNTWLQKQPQAKNNLEQALSQMTLIYDTAGASVYQVPLF